MKPLVIACASLMMAGSALAQSPSTPTNDATPKSGAPATSPASNSTATPGTANPARSGQPASVVSTKDFVKKAAQSDMFELQSSELVVKGNVKDEKTRTFAQHMIADHTKTTMELKQQLQSMKAEGNLPKSPTKAQQKMLERLKGLKGDALAAQYDKDQVAAHQKAVDLFRAYSNTGDEETLKAWAGKTLPALEDHLKMAQQLRK